MLTMVTDLSSEVYLLFLEHLNFLLFLHILILQTGFKLKVVLLIIQLA